MEAETSPSPAGQTWTHEDFPTAQFYHVALTKDFPYQVCGAQQDNSTACVQSTANSPYRRRQRRVARPLRRRRRRKRLYRAEPDGSQYFLCG